MIDDHDDEYLLVTFNEPHNIPRVLLLLSDRDVTTLNPMLKHSVSK